MDKVESKMNRPLDREESIRLAKAYIVEHDNDSLATALADSSCPTIAVLAALLHASGYNSVAVDDAGAVADFLAGPTPALATLQLTYEKGNQKLSGNAASLVHTIYLILSAYEHELLVVVYLPPDMRRDRIQAVCDRLGIDHDFFRSVLRNW